MQKTNEEKIILLKEIWIEYQSKSYLGEARVRLWNKYINLRDEILGKKKLESFLKRFDENRKNRLSKDDIEYN